MKILLVLIAVLMVLSCSVQKVSYVYLSAFEEPPDKCIATNSKIIMVNYKPSIEYLCIGE